MARNQKMPSTVDNFRLAIGYARLQPVGDLHHRRIRKTSANQQDWNGQFRVVRTDGLKAKSSSPIENIRKVVERQ